MLPLFLLMKKLHLVNTYWGVIIPSLATVFGIFLIRQFMLSVPQELLEAARIDGAGELRIYWSVVLPLARPILATLAIFMFMSTWNDFMWPLIVLTDQSHYTLPVALANLVGEHVQDVELMMAGSVVTVLPVLLVFLVLQRYYIAGSWRGASRDEGRGQKAEVLVGGAHFCLLPSASLPHRGLTVDTASKRRCRDACRNRGPRNTAGLRLSRPRAATPSRASSSISTCRRTTSSSFGSRRMRRRRIWSSSSTNGDNVWWLNRRDFVFPREWTTIKTKKRQINFAWGPAGGGEIKHVEAMEIVVTAGGGGRGTVWFSEPELEELPVISNEPLRFDSGEIDLGAKREIGGLISSRRGRTRFCSTARARTPAPLSRSAGEGSYLWLPDAEARRIVVKGAKSVVVEPPTWAPTENDFWSIVAKAAKRGDYPRYLMAEQSYWTIVGADGAKNEALIGEDGNVEPFKGGWSVEPFLVRANGKRLTWADVEITQSLAERIPPDPQRDVEGAGRDHDHDRGGQLVVDAAAPLSRGGRRDAGAGLPQLPGQSLHAVPQLAGRRVEDQDARANGAQRARARHPAGERREGRAAGSDQEVVAREAQSRAHRDRRPVIADTIRSNLAYILINRDGPAIQPGSRSYARSWIRDGALTRPALLRLGHAEEARVLRWFAPYQFADGKVPCCVDRARRRSGAGERQPRRAHLPRRPSSTATPATSARCATLWPHVARASRTSTSCARERTDEYRAVRSAFYGLLPESISHEGYSAKPMHSYWDDFFALAG